MYKKLTQYFALTLALVTVSTQVALPPAAQSYNRRAANYVQLQPNYGYSPYYGRPYYGHRKMGVYQRHPIISRTLTGTALGAVTGLAVGAISGRRRMGRGALIGAGVGTAAGLGYGLYRNRQYTGHWF